MARLPRLELAARLVQAQAREARLDRAQGYLISRPLAGDQLARLLVNGRSLIPTPSQANGVAPQRDAGAG